MMLCTALAGSSPPPRSWPLEPDSPRLPRSHRCRSTPRRRSRLPARGNRRRMLPHDVQLAVTFRHESGSPELTVHGFFDGDGAGRIDGNVLGAVLSDAAGPVDDRRGGLQRKGTRGAASRRPCRGQAFEASRILGSGRREHRSALVSPRGRFAPVHRRQHALHVSLRARRGRSTDGRQNRRGHGGRREILQEGSVWLAKRAVSPPEREAVAGRFGRSHRRRQFFTSPQPALVSPACRSCGAKRPRARPDRRPDPCRARHGRLAHDTEGKAQRGRCDTVPALHRRPSTTAAFPTSGSACATSTTSRARITRKRRSPGWG